ncbi:DUF5317 family protein [Candidatus Clostridium radicumherbarum]|uniref:DUF5317 family protein n=1 Tax=Candidatus Clostridium radicumherbarum TaxID=3381662 RepID=A0ABW8TPM0_9CLOT
MIETILAAMLVAKLKGYKLKPLFKSWEIYPILVFAFIYVFLNTEVFLGKYDFIKYAGILERVYFCTFFLLIIKYKQYVNAIIGSASVIIGTVLNKLAISANNGKMPVYPNLSYITGYIKPDTLMKVKDIHVIGNSTSNLKFLTDFIDIGYSILSIGDIFIRAFVFIIIYGCIKSANRMQVKKFIK